jgi:tryptophanyl-tRNA synthetase
VKDGETLRHQTFEIAVEYFAILGLDTDIRIFRQSDIRDITKLMWILTNVTPYALMLRAHSYKDFEQKKNEIKKQVDNLAGRLALHYEQIEDSRYATNREFIKNTVIPDIEKALANKNQEFLEFVT